MSPEEQWQQQKEKTLAWLRLGFSIIAILVVQLNPARITRFPILSHFSLFTFVIYSGLIFYISRSDRFNFKKIGLWTTILDLVWISVIVFSTGGSRTPFFFYFSFPVITASSRYGVRGGLVVGAIGVTLYGLTRFAPFWVEDPIALDTYIIRGIYLLVLAYVFGFLSEFERKQNDRLVALYRTANEVAAREERRRIGRELHDRLLQVLSTLTLRLEACRNHLIDKPGELDRELNLMEKAAKDSIREIRGFLAGKTIDTIAPGTLIEQIQEEMKFLRDGLGIRMILETEPEDLNIPTELEQEIYYVLREGLLNVARHSQATRAEIYLRQINDVLEGSLTDNGVGFNVDRASEREGFGVVSMEERVKKTGGNLSIESSPGKGTKISFSVPTENSSPSRSGGA
jgi:signal transduction histidine kinase